MAGKLEHEIQDAILTKYGARPDMKLWRMNVGTAVFSDDDKFIYVLYDRLPDGRALYIRVENKSRNKKRFVKFAVKGFSDLHGILPGGRALYIECKREKGGRQRKEQKTFQRVVESLGALYILAPSVADVDKVLIPILERAPGTPENKMYIDRIEMKDIKEDVRKEIEKFRIKVPKGFVEACIEKTKKVLDKVYQEVLTGK